MWADFDSFPISSRKKKWVKPWNQLKLLSKLFLSRFSQINLFMLYNQIGFKPALLIKCRQK